MIPAMIVPILARPELLHRMVSTIDRPVERLVVIDNGSVVEDLDPPTCVQGLTVLRMPANLGVAGSWNLGIKATPFAPWWLIANFDVTWPAGSLAAFDELRPSGSLALGGGSPAWCAFAIGEDVIARVGLFDEAFHPGYFEDDDMQRRCEAAGIYVQRTGIPVDHLNSSTLKAGFDQANTRTFTANEAYHADKQARGDLSPGQWSLSRRRRLSWD